MPQNRAGNDAAGHYRNGTAAQRCWERMAAFTMPQGKSSLAVTVAASIRDAIVNAKFGFGEALSEENLAAAFEVSRTPVREALNLLQLEGLVSIVPKSGTYVFTPTLEDISEICEYRAVLETHAAELAARDNPEALAAELTALADEMEAAMKAQDIPLYGRLDSRYHEAFFENARNRYLVMGFQMIMGRVATLRTQLALHARNEPERSYGDHRRMIELIRKGDTARLKQVLRAHIRRTQDNYMQAFQANPIRPLTAREAMRRKLGPLKS